MMSGLAPTRTVPTRTLWAIRAGSSVLLQGYATREEAEADLAFWREKLPSPQDMEILSYSMPDWEALGIGGHAKEGQP